MLCLCTAINQISNTLQITWRKYITLYEGVGVDTVGFAGGGGGGGGVRQRFILKTTTSEFVYPKKSLLCFAYSKKSLSPFFASTQKNPSVFFFVTQKNPGVFHTPKKITFGQNFRLKKITWTLGAWGLHTFNCHSAIVTSTSHSFFLPTARNSKQNIVSFMFHYLLISFRWW